MALNKIALRTELNFIIRIKFPAKVHIETVVEQHRLKVYLRSTNWIRLVPEHLQRTDASDLGCR
jgi:hypothetical protein